MGNSARHIISLYHPKNGDGQFVVIFPAIKYDNSDPPLPLWEIAYILEPGPNRTYAKFSK
ncbi:hypothetical protein DHC50_01075 [Arenibacter sp. A80]|nr:hypothetical protein [Arenibacter sp. A80]RFT57789.1 hypothetical protein D0S24_01075 [Arenibacter sp. P308M17]